LGFGFAAARTHNDDEDRGVYVFLSIMMVIREDCNLDYENLETPGITPSETDETLIGAIALGYRSF